MVRRSILLAVTIDDSLQFLSGFPEYLVAHDWDVHLVSNSGPRLASYESLAGVETHGMAMAREPRVAQDIGSLLRWVKMLRQVRPDVVSVGTPKAGFLGSIAALLTRVPARVYLLRGLRLETSTGIGRIFLSAMERLTMACATDVQAISPSLRNRALELKLLPASKIRVVGSGSSNGTDTAKFDRGRFSPDDLDARRRELRLEPELPIVGFVGRLTRDKGLFLLAEASEKAFANGHRFQLLVVGGVDDETGQEALSVLSRLPIPVTITGHIAELAGIYPLMDIFCLPSYREGFGNVVIEASSSEVPVIVTDATGITDTVSEGKTGLVVPVGDSSALAAAIERLIADNKLARSLGRQGRIWVQENFERAAVQHNYEGDLRSVLVRTASRRPRVDQPESA